MSEGNPLGNMEQMIRNSLKEIFDSTWSNFDALFREVTIKYPSLILKVAYAVAYSNGFYTAMAGADGLVQAAAQTGEWDVNKINMLMDSLLRVSNEVCKEVIGEERKSLNLDGIEIN